MVKTDLGSSSQGSMSISARLSLTMVKLLNTKVRFLFYEYYRAIYSADFKNCKIQKQQSFFDMTYSFLTIYKHKFA